MKKYVQLYMERIVCLHGVYKTIISDRGTQFVSRFWEQQSSLGTKLIHIVQPTIPQTDGHTERVNQILEDMFRATVMHFDNS